MAVQCEDGEILKKKAVAGLYYTPKKKFITKMYITDQRIIFKNQRKQYIKIPYDQIHDITVEDLKVCIRCSTPQRFFLDKEEYIRVYFHGLKRKEGGVITILNDPKWAKAWKKYLEAQVKAYHEDILRKKHELQNQEDELLFIESAQRTTEGLDPFEIVKNKEKMKIKVDGYDLETCTLYATNNRMLLKIKSSDYLVFPYSLIYAASHNANNNLCIALSYPQQIEGFEGDITKILIERIPEPDEEYPEKKISRWIEDWEEFFKKITNMFKAHKGAISHDEMAEMLVEMKHSPTKYNLSAYGKQGWDRACGRALDYFSSHGDDLYIFQNFLLHEYEEMKTVSMVEPDPARRDAYSGSEMAYNAILAYITQHNKA